MDRRLPHLGGLPHLLGVPHLHVKKKALKVVVALAIREFEHRRHTLTSRERRKINSWTRIYLFMKASRVVLRGVRFCEKPLTYYVIRNSLGDKIWSI